MSTRPVAVRVWRVDLDAPTGLPAVEAAAPAELDDHERAIAARCAPERARRYVAAHMAARAVLGAELGEPAGAIRFDRSCEHCGQPDHGRPRVVGAADLGWSLSHSGGVALIALAARGTATRIGVDVEVERSRRHLARLAARVLEPDDHARWRALPADERLRAFLRSWTEREAVAKARGLGILGAARQTDDTPCWYVEPVDAGAAAVASLASDAPAVVVVGRFPA